MSRKRRQKIKRIKVLVFVFILTIAFISVGVALNSKENNNNVAQSGDTGQTNNKKQNNDDTNKKDKDNVSKTKPSDKKQDITINIAATGDIMFHPSQIEGAYDEANGTYDFKNSFKAVKPIFEVADLAIANFEGTTAGNEDYKYQGYPLFNAPDEVLDAIKDAGFDVLSTVNNHCLDTRKKGIIKTIDKIHERNMDTVGTYKAKPETRVLMKDVKGINLAFIAYTESVNGLESVIGAEDLDAMVNLVDKAKIKEDIAYAKNKGADVVIAIMHWGNEYNRTAADRQRELSDYMFTEGVDIIFGSHPHVIQESEKLKYDGRDVFVAYSMGNFISNQRVETLQGDVVNPYYTEDGVIINVQIEKKGETGEISIKSIDTTPLWVYKGKLENGKTEHVVYPIMEYIESDEMSKDSKERMNRSYKDTMSQMFVNK